MDRSLACSGLAGVLSGVLLLYAAAHAETASAAPVTLEYGPCSIGFDGDDIDVRDFDFNSADLLRALNLKLGLDGTMDLRLEYDRYQYELRDDTEFGPVHIYVSLHSKFD